MEFAPTHPIPLFPLPEFVLFPCTTAPLHVFETRYRALVQDAVRGDRLLAMALLKPGWENDYYGSPEFHEVGCLGRLEEVEWRPDDCFDVKVLGVSRVRFRRVVRDSPYRTVVVTLLQQEPLADGDPLVRLEHRALVEACEAARVSLPLSGSTLEEAVNSACMSLPILAAHKLELLEMDSVLERSRRVREALEARGGAGPASGERN